MSKYTLQMKQSVDYDDETSCFENLVQAIDALFADGFMVTRIKRNKYCFENPDNGKKAVLTILKGKE